MNDCSFLYGILVGAGALLAILAVLALVYRKRTPG